MSDKEFDAFASIADSVKSDYIKKDNPWVDSPFSWIMNLPPRSRGKLGEKLIASWCAARGLDTNRVGDSDADIIINGNRVEVKFSTLWESGIYAFQQIRDQEYDQLVCLGISPEKGHCWVLSKEILLEHVIGHRPQHGGKDGRDTFWLQVDQNNVEGWMENFGGSLEKGLENLKKMRIK